MTSFYMGIDVSKGYADMKREQSQSVNSTECGVSAPVPLASILADVLNKYRGILPNFQRTFRGKMARFLP